MSVTSAIADPIALLRDLTVEQLRERLGALDAESRALRVLLRSALARQRGRRCETRPSEQEEARHGV